ncbi:MAG TPA: tetratricopeptide repeat protein [Gemmatimonadales bacterium]|nr:tetratricopeptide repeat protein [Gemmatimonadales bacterium]
MTTALLRALALVAIPGLLTAQLPEAEAAFRRGDYAAARAGYERVLVTDSLNVRALYRLAILDSWDGKLSRSLQRFARLRRLEPRDGDIMVSQAQVLAWAGKTRAAEALYDSVLADSPGRADALAGRARAVAWSGNLERAERLWRAALALHPDDAELLVGLAQTLSWKGQPALAEAYAVRARALAPGDRAARDVERMVRAALRPEVGTWVDGAGDSDDNEYLVQEATVTTSLGPNLRGSVHAGWRHTTDPTRAGTSYGAGAYGILALGGDAVLRAGAGVRRIDADSGPGRTPLIAQLGLGIRPARYAAVSLAYTRAPFDETARLMRQDLMLDGLDLSFDVSPKAGWSISGGANATWLSDGNRRLAAVGAALARVAPGLELGPFARIMGYRESPGTGYFAPDRFTVMEGRAVYAWQKRRWGVRADGGLGSQQVFKGAAHQAEWHVGLTLSRGWGANNEVALAGAVTNSAGATTSSGLRSEQFRYRSLRLSFRQGL